MITIMYHILYTFVVQAFQNLLCWITGPRSISLR